MFNSVNQPFQQGQASYIKRTANVSAGNAPFVINARCKFIAILNVTGDVRISIDNGEATEITGGIQIKAPTGVEFSTITLFSVAGATVEYAYSMGEIFDSRLTVSGSINLTAGQTILTSSGGTIYTSQYTIGTTRVPVSGSVAAKRRATIKSFSSNSANVYIGPSTCTITTGHLLEPGDSFTMDSTAGLWAISTTVGQLVSVIEESV